MKLFNKRKEELELKATKLQNQLDEKEKTIQLLKGKLGIENEELTPEEIAELDSLEEIAKLKADAIAKADQLEKELNEQVKALEGGNNTETYNAELEEEKKRLKQKWGL